MFRVLGLPFPQMPTIGQNKKLVVKSLVGASNLCQVDEVQNMWLRGVKMGSKCIFT